MGIDAAAVVELSPAELRDRRTQLVDLLADAIDGGASVNYVLPFRREDLDAYWQGVAVDVENRARTVLAIIDEDRVTGSVQLVPCRKPNQPHRADVEKPRWGWHAAGNIPDYALDPDGKPAACTFYWKPLA